MSYTLYTDRNENFECEVSVKNASLKNSMARLVVESEDGPSLIFTGKIERDKCVVPIKKLKGLLGENTYGKMHLEVIVEDTYFKPWESSFVVEEHTSVKVKVNENKEQQSNKPIVELKKVKVKSQRLTEKKGINIYIPLKEISVLCEQFGIKKKNISKNRKELAQILKEYFKANPEYNNHRKDILSKVGSFIK